MLVKKKEKDIFKGKNNLAKFLIKKRAYQKALDNIKERWEDRAQDKINYFFGEDKGKWYMSSLFTWDRTPEGHTFWSELSEDFDNELEYEERKRRADHIGGEIT